MRRWIVAVLVLCLGLPMLGAEAGAQKNNKQKPKRSERVTEAVYDGPTFGSPSSPAALCYTPVTCPYFAVAQEERFVMIEVEDASGTPTAFRLGQDTEEGPGVGTDYGIFCGSTGKKPIRLEAPGAQLLVEPYAFGDVVCLGAVGTTGTVTATLSNLP